MVPDGQVIHQALTCSRLRADIPCNVTLKMTTKQGGVTSLQDTGTVHIDSNFPRATRYKMKHYLDNTVQCSPQQTAEEYSTLLKCMEEAVQQKAVQQKAVQQKAVQQKSSFWSWFGGS